MRVLLNIVSRFFSQLRCQNWVSGYLYPLLLYFFFYDVYEKKNKKQYNEPSALDNQRLMKYCFSRETVYSSEKQYF